MLVYKSDFFEKKKTCHQTALTALSIGHVEPQVWQDLEKAWENWSSGGRVHHFLAFIKKHVKLATKTKTSFEIFQVLKKKLAKFHKKNKQKNRGE